MHDTNSRFSPAVEGLLERLARELKALILSEGMEDVLLWAEISLFSIHGNVWGALIKKDDKFTHHALAVTHTGHPEVIKNNPLYKEDTNFPQEFSISQVLEKLRMELRHQGMYEIYWYPGGNSRKLIEIINGSSITDDFEDGFLSWWNVVRDSTKCGKPDSFVFFPVVVSSRETERLVGGVFFALANVPVKDALRKFYRLRSLFHLVIAQNFSRELSRYAGSATVGSIATFISLTLEHTKSSGSPGWFCEDAHNDGGSEQRQKLKDVFEFECEYDLDSHKGMFETSLRVRHPPVQDLFGRNARRLLPKAMIEDVIKHFTGDGLQINWDSSGSTQHFSLPCQPGWMFLASLADFINKEAGSESLEMFQHTWGDRVMSGVSVQLKEPADNADLSALHAAINNLRRRGQTTKNIDDLMYVRLNRREYNFESDYDDLQLTYARHIVKGSEIPVVSPLLVGKSEGYSEIRFVWFGPGIDMGV